MTAGKGSLFIVLLTLLFVACEGQEGPIGPPGPGQRIVYHGYADADPYTVMVPEIRLDDFPLVQCYYYLEGAWSTIESTYSENGEIVYPLALIEEGRVTLLGIAGLEFKIVIII